MRDRELRELLARAHATLTFLDARLITARANAYQWAGVGRTNWTDGSSRTSGADPTQQLALAGTVAKDEVMHRAGKLEEAIVGAATLLEQVRGHVTWLTEVVPENDRPDAPTCRSCARADHPNRGQRVYRDGLCAWCDEFRARYGCLPATELVAWHLDHPGAHITRSGQDLIRRHHPAEFERYHGAA